MSVRVDTIGTELLELRFSATCGAADRPYTRKVIIDFYEAGELVGQIREAQSARQKPRDRRSDAPTGKE